MPSNLSLAELDRRIAVLRDNIRQLIEQALSVVAAAVRSAKSEGQAMGIAMKHLKTTGATVDAPSVQQAVKKLRG